MDITKDLYSILELSKDANQEELKSSYRRLVRKYHPDSGATADHAMFQLVQDAWDILGDPEKRLEYDRKKSQDNWDSIRDDKLSKFQERGATLHNFGQANPLTDSGSWTYPRGKTPSRDENEPKPQTTSIIDRLKTIASGKKSEPLKVNTEKQAESNNISIEQKLAIKVSPIDIWFGTSKDLEINSPVGKRKIRVKVPKGTTSGTCLNVTCKQSDRYPAQNIQVIVELQTRFDVKIDGQDIIMHVPISYSEVVLGEELIMRTPDGKIKVKIPANFELGKLIRVNNAGIEQSLHKGDLLIKPVLAPMPESSSLRKILTKLDELYQGDIRAKLFDELESREVD